VYVNALNVWKTTERKKILGPSRKRLKTDPLAFAWCVGFATDEYNITNNITYYNTRLDATTAMHTEWPRRRISYRWAPKRPKPCSSGGENKKNKTRSRAVYLYVDRNGQNNYSDRVRILTCTAQYLVSTRCYRRYSNTYNIIIITYYMYILR